MLKQFYFKPLSLAYVCSLNTVKCQKLISNNSALKKNHCVI